MWGKIKTKFFYISNILGNEICLKNFGSLVIFGLEFKRNSRGNSEHVWISRKVFQSLLEFFL